MLICITCWEITQDVLVQWSHMLWISIVSIVHKHGKQVKYCSHQDVLISLVARWWILYTTKCQNLKTIIGKFFLKQAQLTGNSLKKSSSIQACIMGKCSFLALLNATVSSSSCPTTIPNDFSVMSSRTFMKSIKLYVCNGFTQIPAYIWSRNSIQEWFVVTNINVEYCNVHS